MTQPPSLLDLWKSALESPVGKAVITNPDDRQVLRMQLYKARADSGDPALNELVIIIPEIENELWIVKRDANEPTAG